MVGLDGSSQMLAKAGELLAPHGERAALRTFRLEDSSWMEALPPVRVFLSSLVLHHLDGPGKRELFERLLFGLEPGGALLFADLMQPPDMLADTLPRLGSGKSDVARRRSTATGVPGVLRARAVEHLRVSRSDGHTLDASRAVALDGGRWLRGVDVFLGDGGTRAAWRLQAR